jgi:hypothetical protein
VYLYTCCVAVRMSGSGFSYKKIVIVANFNLISRGLFCEALAFLGCYVSKLFRPEVHVLLPASYAAPASSGQLSSPDSSPPKRKAKVL